MRYFVFILLSLFLLTEVVRCSRSPRREEEGSPRHYLEEEEEDVTSDDDFAYEVGRFPWDLNEPGLQPELVPRSRARSLDQMPPKTFHHYPNLDNIFNMEWTRSPNPPTTQASHRRSYQSWSTVRPWPSSTEGPPNLYPRDYLSHSVYRY